MNNIEIYTRPGCAYCFNAKQLLDERGLDYVEYDTATAPERLSEMRSRSTLRTFPQIFINEQSVGGFDDLFALDQHTKLNTL